MFVNYIHLIIGLIQKLVFLTQTLDHIDSSSITASSERFNAQHKNLFILYFVTLPKLCELLYGFFWSIVFASEKKLCQSRAAKSFITCQKDGGQIIASRCEAFSLIAAFISCLCFFRQPITPQRELLLKYTAVL